MLAQEFPATVQYETRCQSMLDLWEECFKSLYVLCNFQIRVLYPKKLWSDILVKLISMLLIHSESGTDEHCKHFIDALLLHEALKHDLHLSILSTQDRSDIACWWWFARFGDLPVRCIKSIMPSLLTRDKIMYDNWHLWPSTVSIWPRILRMVEFTSTTDWHLNKDQRL
jgi:hypothetical protein